MGDVPGATFFPNKGGGFFTFTTLYKRENTEMGSIWYAKVCTT